VLADGTHTYLYGSERLAQQSSAGKEDFLTDALGSVREIVNADAEVVLGESYQPYGSALVSSGEGASSYGYAGEWTDASGLQYLRAR
jgi:hypothetical protein